MIYGCFEYKYVIGISCYREFVGSIQSGEHDSVESAIDHLSMLTNNGSVVSLSWLQQGTVLTHKRHSLKSKQQNRSFPNMVLAQCLHQV